MPLGKWPWNEVTYIGIAFWCFVLSYMYIATMLFESTVILMLLDQLKGGIKPN